MRELIAIGTMMFILAMSGGELGKAKAQANACGLADLDTLMTACNQPTTGG